MLDVILTCKPFKYNLIFFFRGAENECVPEQEGGNIPLVRRKKMCIL